MRKTAIVLSVLLASSATVGCGHPMLRTLVVSQLADNISTQMSVKDGRHEANPWLPDNHWANAGIQLGTTVGVAYLLQKWEPSNPKLVHTLEVLGIGLASRDTIVNMQHWNEDRNR